MKNAEKVERIAFMQNTKSDEIKTIAELQDEKYAIITNDMEVDDIADCLGIARYGYDGFLVHAENGDYVEVWGFFGSVPILTKQAYRER